MTLSANQLQHICLLNCKYKEKTCRYLENDELDEGRWYCQKLRPNVKSKIDNEVEQAKKRNIIVACGDNCQGYPFLRHMSQGYDVD